MKPNRKEFNYLYKQMDDLYHDIAVHAGLSDSAFTILYGLLDIGDGCLQKDISSQYSISRQTINSSIKNLEKKWEFFDKMTKTLAYIKNIGIISRKKKYLCRG